MPIITSKNTCCFSVLNLWLVTFNFTSITEPLGQRGKYQTLGSFSYIAAVHISTSIDSFLVCISFNNKVNIKRCNFFFFLLWRLGVDTALWCTMAFNLLCSTNVLNNLKSVVRCHGCIGRVFWIPTSFILCIWAVPWVIKLTITLCSVYCITLHVGNHFILQFI